ncbi:hypothetical protein SLS64_012439 [Diaporthe eres]
MASTFNFDTKASELWHTMQRKLRGKSLSLQLQGLIEELNTLYPTVIVKSLALNLLSFADVRKAAETLNSWADVPHVDVLVNNAGIMAVPYQLTEDGFESQFQTNHLSHFLFTNLIMDKILASKAPRVVHVSSGVHRIGHIRWTDYNFNEGKHYQRWLSFALCPGVILTNLAAHGLDDRDSFAADLTSMDNVYGNKSLWGMADMKFKTLDQGAATHVFASFDNGIREHNGSFLSDCHVADQNLEEVYSWATSKVDAERLWNLSEKLVGQEFTF